MWQRIAQFLREDIWRVRIRTVPRPRSWLLRLLRVTWLAFRGFAEDRCQLRASALTFYTLLSIVPVLGTAFGIAKGFGLQERLREFLVEQLWGQEEVLRWFLRFTDSLLANTQGGVVAGVGVAVLFWAVIKLLGHVERALNDIWGARRGRNLARKISDYLALMLICPIVLILSSSATVFLTTQVTAWTGRFGLLSPLQEQIVFLLGLLPFAILWSLLAFLYRVIPSTSVSLSAAIIAGIVAGTTYQLAQWAYVYFQIGVSRHNAIYGGFAALPLFLIWLQISWLIVLFGAEVSFAIDNESTYEFEQESLNVSRRLKTLLALRIAELCVKRFVQAGGPVEAADIARRLEAPVRLVREGLFELTSAGILAEVKSESGDSEAYQPARDSAQLTIAAVLHALDARGLNTPSMLNPEELSVVSRHVEVLEKQTRESFANVLLRDLRDDPPDIRGERS